MNEKQTRANHIAEVEKFTATAVAAFTKHFDPTKPINSNLRTFSTIANKLEDSAAVTRCDEAREMIYEMVQVYQYIRDALHIHITSDQNQYPYTLESFLDTHARRITENAKQKRIYKIEFDEHYDAYPLRTVELDEATINHFAAKREQHEKENRTE